MTGSRFGRARLLSLSLSLSLLIGGLVLASPVGGVEGPPPWGDEDLGLIGAVLVPVEAGEDAGSAPRLWCTSGRTATFVQSGDPTVRFVRAWVPAGATLRVKRAGRASLVAWNWWFQAEYAVEHTVFAADGVTELDESGWPITVHADGSTPGMPGWKFFGPSDYPVFTNHSASGREVVVRVTTDETGGGAGLEWRGTFYSKLDGSVVEGNPPRCPTSTRPDTETDRPGWSLKRSCAARTDEGEPIDTRTGNFWFGLPGLSVSGRGAGLGFGLMFSSSDAAVDGPTGFGWSSLLSMRVRVDGSDAVTVVEETGATVPFSKTGGVWGAPGRFSAGLVESPGGGWVFTRNHFEVFRFDAAGLLVGFGDQFGNETTLSYGPGGQVEFMEDEAGRRLVFEWDGARLDSVADDPLVGDRSIQFGYDPAGNLTSFTDVGDGVWSFAYDGEHRVIRVRKPRHQPAGPEVVNSYDHQGRLHTQTDEAGSVTRFDFFTPGPGSTVVTFPSGRQRIDHYDTAGVCTGRTMAPGTALEEEVAYVRDPVTLALEQVTSPAGVVVFENDARGNREMARDASGRVTRWTYNLFDQVTSVSVGETAAPLPPSTANVVTSTVAYNADGMPETVVDAVGTLDEASTTLVYDPVHRDDLVEVIDGRSQHWTYSYDPGTGDMVSVTDPLGNKTSMGYDPIGRLEWVVAPKGNLVGADPDLWKTRLVSDEFGRVIEETDPLGNRVKTGYDLNGNMNRVETGLSATVTTGDVTTYGYDVVDRLEVVDPPGPGARSYEYDPDGRRTRFVNELNGQWVYDYDGLGRLESVTDPVNATTGYTWNDEGRLGSVTQPGGSCVAPRTSCITYAYDLAGRPTGVDYADPATPDITAITYDAVGRRTHASRGGDTEMWVWDQRSRLKSHTDVNARTTSYGWDDTGNLTSIGYPGQTTPVTREFDDAGRLESVTDWTGRLTTFGYDQNSNWSETVFPVSSQNRDVYSFDRADRMVGVAWNRGSTVLGSLSYGPRDLKGQVTTVTGTGAVTGQNQSWSYDDQDRLTSTGTEGFGFDAATNLVDADGVLQVFDPAQRLCWTSQTAEGGDCGTPPADATTYGYDARGNRTSMTYPSGTTATYGFDAENRMTSAVLPTTWQDDTARQYVPVPASRIVDTTTGAGTCDGAPCARIAADDPVAVKVAGVGGVPASGVTAVVVSIIASGTTGDGWLEVNPAGDAAAGTLPLNAGQTTAQTVTAKLAGNGTITLVSGVGVDVSVDVVGYFRAPSPWVPALNYWPLTPTVTAESTSGTGVCDGSPCGTLPAGETDIATAGHGGIPATGVNAVTVSILAQNANGGHVRVAPSGDAAAGELVWETGSVGAAGVFTVPLNPDGTITLHTTSPADVRVAVTGYWKIPTGTDTGLGLDLLEAPTRLVDTTNGTGICDDDPCDTLQANTPVEVAVTGQGGMGGEIMAVMVSVTAIDPTGTGVLGVGTTEADMGGGVVVFDPAQHASTTMIIPLTGTGTFTIGSWTETDVAVDVIGVFRAPTRTWRYEYDTTGMRTAKQLDNTTGTGAEWRKEHTWTASGGLPLLLAEHQGAQSAYVIYGPGGTAIYQINTTGEVQYLHQDHQGSTRLTTNANGTTRNTITYNAHGEITANTNWWLEQPLNGYTGQYHDPETGYIYLRARHYDPTTGQFITVDPLVTLTQEPYGYVGGNPANGWDPTGLWPWDDRCIDIGALPLVGSDSSCITRSEMNGGTLGGLKSLAVDDPGQFATIVASVACLGGPGLCAAAQGFAIIFRGLERWRECDKNWVRNTAVDGLVTYIFFALGTLPAAGAAGKLGGSFADDAAANVSYGFFTTLMADFASWVGLAAGVPRDE